MSKIDDTQNDAVIAGVEDVNNIQVEIVLDKNVAVYVQVVDTPADNVVAAVKNANNIQVEMVPDIPTDAPMDNHDTIDADACPASVNNNDIDMNGRKFRLMTSTPLT